MVVRDGALSEKDIGHCHPEMLVSYCYRHIISDRVLRSIGDRAINLHISLLPWNRGAHPNVWSFLDNTPKGVTIHLINGKIDNGDILLQKEVYFEEKEETLHSSYMMLHEEIQSLFTSNWHKIRTLKLEGIPQPLGGSMHFERDFGKIKKILGDDGWYISIPELKRRFMGVGNNASRKKIQR